MRNNSWITTIILGKVEEKSGRGRLRTQFMKKIIENLGKNSGR